MTKDTTTKYIPPNIQKNQEQNHSTPCIGVCSTIYGDQVCRGCHRFYDEIINWNGLDISSKVSINSRLDSLQNKYMRQYFRLPSPDTPEYNKLSDFIKQNLINKISCTNPSVNQGNIYSKLYKLIKQETKKNNPANNHINNKINHKPSHITQTLCKKFNILIDNPQDIAKQNIIPYIDEKIYQESNTIFTKENTRCTKT